MFSASLAHQSLSTGYTQLLSIILKLQSVAQYNFKIWVSCSPDAQLRRVGKMEGNKMKKSFWRRRRGAATWKAALNRDDGGYQPYPNKRKYRLEKYEKLAKILEKYEKLAKISNQFTGEQVRSSNSLCSKYFLKNFLYCFRYFLPPQSPNQVG